MKAQGLEEALDPAIYSPSRRKLHAELRLLRARASRLNCPATARSLDLALEMFIVDCEEAGDASSVHRLEFPPER